MAGRTRKVTSITEEIAKQEGVETSISGQVKSTRGTEETGTVYRSGKEWQIL